MSFLTAPRVVAAALAACFLLGAAPAAHADDPVFDRAFGAGPADLCSTVCRAGANGSAAGQLSAPADVAVSGGEVFVADRNNHRISVYATDGTFARAFGKNVNLGLSGNPDVCTSGSTCRAGAPGATAGQLNNPYAIAVTGGEVFVADASNNRVSVFSTSGVFVRAFGKDVNAGQGDPDVCTASSTCRAGSQGSAPGQLSFPLGVAVDGGEVYVADATNNRISVYSAGGSFARTFGSAGSAAGQLSFPFHVAVSGSEVYVADQNNHRVSVFATNGTFARAFGKNVNAGSGSADVCTAATTCRGGTTGGGAGNLTSPLGVAVSGSEVYVIDANQRVSVFLADGTFARAFGKGVNASGGDPNVCTTLCQGAPPGGAAGQLSNPGGMGVVAGEVFVADSSNIRVDVFSTAGTFARAFGKSVMGSSPFVCTTLSGCGPGTPGGAAAQLNLPTAVAVAGGEAYVADQANNRITVYATNGTFARAFGKDVNAGAGTPDVCTLATTCRTGTPGVGAGQLSMPAGVAVAGGEVFVADQNNHRVSVFTTSGTFVRAFGKDVNPGSGNPNVCTVATTCRSASLGGAAGQFDNPVAVAVAGGEVYVTDQGNRRISVFSTAGTFARAFGKDVNAGAGDPDVCTTATTCRFGSQGGAAGQLNGPTGLAVAGGEVYVADSFNNRVSVFGTGGTFVRAFGKGANASATGNPDICTAVTTCRAASMGGTAGQIPFAAGVAVGDGAVYVSERFNARLSVFGPDGTFSRAFGRGANAGAGSPDVCTTTCRAAAQGDAAGQFMEPLGVAMVGTNIFVADRTSHRVALFRVPRTEITADPVGLAYGARDVDDGPTAVQTATVTNTGTEPVTLSGFALSGDAAQFARLTGVAGDCATSLTLTAGETCTLRLRFDPTATGAKASTLTVTSNAPAITVALSGTGIQTELSRTPSFLAFGARDVDDGPTAVQTATIANTGTETLSLLGLAFSGDGAHFARLTGDCAATSTLASGASCTLRLRFDPSSTGAKGATLTITSSAGTATIDLTGTAIQTELSRSPATLAFGMRDIDGGASSVQTSTVTNTGTEPVTLTSLAVAGDTTQFTRLTGASSDCTATTALTAGATCALRWQFDPSTTGAKAVTVTMTSNAATITVGVTGTGTNTVLTRTPATLAFGARDVEQGPTAAQTATIANAGSEPVTFSALTLSGDATEFARLTGATGDCATATTLAPGATCAVRVRFEPTSTGTKAATLTLTSNAPTLSVALTGSAVHPELSRDPASIAFGVRDVDQGSSATQNVTIANTGSDAVTLTALTLAGDAGDFVRVTGEGGDCASATRLTPGQSCTVRLRFDPASIGAKSAALTVASNAPSLTVALTGSGIQTQLSSDPPSLDLGARDINEGAATQRATIANTGSEPVTLTGVALSGDTAQFERLAEAAGDCSATTRLDAGETCSLRVRFDPSSTGGKSAAVAITSNAPTLVVGLSGAGTTAKSDSDGDGVPDLEDDDDDNDGFADDRDAFPLDPSRHAEAASPAPPQPEPQPQPRPVVPAAAPKPWRLRRTAKPRVTDRRGVLRVATGLSIACPAGGPACTGVFTLKLVRRSVRTRKTIPIFLTAKARATTIPAGTTKPLTLRLSERGAELLRRLGTLDAQLRGSVRRGGGGAVARRAKLRLAAPQRR